MKDSAQTIQNHCTETHVNLTVIFLIDNKPSIEKQNKCFYHDGECPTINLRTEKILI